MNPVFIKFSESEKTQFIDNFLVPLTKVTDRAALICKEDNVYSIQTSEDNTLIVYSRLKVNTPFENYIRINVGDLNRFIKLLQSIPHPQIDLEIKENHIFFKAKSMKFKYHLLDDSVLMLPPINIKQILAFEGKNEFTLSNDNLSKIIKLGSLTPHSNKIYLNTKEGHLYGELTDRTKQNIDSIDVLIAEDVGFEIDDFICFDLDQMRLIYNKNMPKFKFSIQQETGLVSVDCALPQTQTKFILTTFVQ